MAPQAVIDSHVHLWPAETANEEGHIWMTPGMPLAKQHLLKDYYTASEQDGASKSDVEVQGVIYIETDVRYEPPSGDLATWVSDPLEEILFLRKIIEGNYGERDSNMILAFVPWAPMDQPTFILEKYLELAKDMAGPKAWPRLKGFRFLLQSVKDQGKFENLVFSDDFVNNLRLLGKRGFSFDVGVDQRSGGTWQLEAIGKALTRAHENVVENEKITTIINHLCKPNFEAKGSDFDRWCKAVAVMAYTAKSYMKLSGAFSELPSRLKSTSSIGDHMKPWIKQILACYGANRIMFGSDWPVCNLKGPTGEASWFAWKDAVKHILQDESYQLVTEDKQRIWFGTAVEAYGIQSSLLFANQSRAQIPLSSKQP